MKQSNLIREIVINGVSMKGDQQFNLDYSIVQDSDETYGIEIQKISSNSSCSERAVAMISDRKEDALSLMKKLAKYEVTPMSLGDIVEDLTN